MKIIYYEVTGPGSQTIKNFQSKENAERFAQEERARRMEDLKGSTDYTRGEIKGETTYRTHGIIVRKKEIEFSDDDGPKTAIFLC